MAADTAKGFAVFAGVAPEIIRASAREAESRGFASFWVNHPGPVDGLGSLAQAAAETQRIDLGVGVIPLHTRGPEAIVAGVRQHGLAPARLLLGVGSPNPQALARVRDGVQAAAEGEGVAAAWQLDSADPGSTFDAGLRARLHAAARAAGVEAVDLAAYAGHDAGVLARHLPAAMLFVRNPTGISHNPAEHAAEDDCLAACEVLAGVLAGTIRP
jgi:acetylornithine deacetylase/succinyl-diaminopimelate desuccinylase-like protein